MAWLFRKHSRQDDTKYLTSVSLDLREDSKYYFFLSDFKSKCRNQFLWTYIERDVIFSLLSNFFVVAHLDSFDPIELDDDIRDFYPNQTNPNGECAVCLGVNDRRFITDIMEEHDLLWDYGDLINLKAFPPSKFEGGPSIELPSIRSATDYILNIQPTGDDIGILISINPQLQSREEIIDKILIVLNEYHINLEYREIDRI